MATIDLLIFCLISYLPITYEVIPFVYEMLVIATPVRPKEIDLKRLTMSIVHLEGYSLET